MTCHSRKQKYISIHRLSDHADVHTYIHEHARNDENKQDHNQWHLFEVDWWIWASHCLIFPLLLSNDSLVGRSALSIVGSNQPELVSVSVQLCTVQGILGGSLSITAGSDANQKMLLRQISNDPYGDLLPIGLGDMHWVSFAFQFLSETCGATHWLLTSIRVLLVNVTKGFLTIRYERHAATEKRSCTHTHMYMYRHVHVSIDINIPHHQLRNALKHTHLFAVSKHACMQRRWILCKQYLYAYI